MGHIRPLRASANPCVKLWPARCSIPIFPSHSISAELRFAITTSSKAPSISTISKSPPSYLNHPALTLGYRLQADGVAVVYACDHEPHSRMLASGDGEITGQDLRHAEFIDGADLLIHDAQYTAEEYPDKVGWGHSTVEYVMKLAQYARGEEGCTDPSRSAQG